MARNWTAARKKVRDEGRCRCCHGIHALEAAHIVPRSRIKPGPAEDPRNILPLCNTCHRAQHAGHLSLGPLLTDVERAYVIELVGEGEAERRLAA